MKRYLIILLAILDIICNAFNISVFVKVYFFNKGILPAYLEDGCYDILLITTVMLYWVVDGMYNKYKTDMNTAAKTVILDAAEYSYLLFGIFGFAISAYEFFSTHL